MTRAELRKKAVQAIDRRHCLLVYPLANRPEPKSLWSELFPRSRMRWEWDAGADNRVSELWSLREELSRSRQVIYAKWYQNRATFFSTEAFANFLAFFRAGPLSEALAGDSRNILGLLQSDSPLSTKQLKAAAELQGRFLESQYNRAMKPLWQNLLVVGFGEFDDSSFPSLGIGATQVLFEEVWNASLSLDPRAAELWLKKTLGEDSVWFKFALKVRHSSSTTRALR